MIPNKNEILAAALSETNNWFANTLNRPDLRLELVDGVSARRVALDFERGGARRRKVKWHWENLFFTKVRFKDAWMYAIVRGGRPRSMCYGRIEVGKGYVSLEYLERVPYARGIRGLATPAAFTFARTIASLLDLNEARVNQPFAQLVRYYERSLGVIRHPAVGTVEYLYWKAKP